MQFNAHYGRDQSPKATPVVASSCIHEDMGLPGSITISLSGETSFRCFYDGSQIECCYNLHFPFVIKLNFILKLQSSRELNLQQNDELLN